MKFAFITEGPSEHRILKHIVHKYFKELEYLDIEINQIQPKMTNGKQASVGGWNEVLKYCSRPELKDIFVENDYLIIQLDTDQSETAPFSISHSKSGGIAKTSTELFVEVQDKMIALMGSEIWGEYRHRILFAICIHTIECWLLPLFAPPKKAVAIRKCLSTLNMELHKKKINPIPNKDKNNPQSIRTYETVLKNWRRKQDIIDSSMYSFGFEKLVEALRMIEEIIKTQ